MEMLLEEATDGTAHRHRQIVFDPELVIRESTVRTTEGP
jgi:DNA-binding LacI/PurR family transcriptional regulator